MTSSDIFPGVSSSQAQLSSAGWSPTVGVGAGSLGNVEVAAVVGAFCCRLPVAGPCLVFPVCGLFCYGDLIWSCTCVLDLTDTYMSLAVVVRLYYCA